MIIIEGANGSGKTTLVNRLAQDLDLKIHKFKSIPRSREEFESQVAESLSLCSKRVVQDRCPFISDYAYAQFNTTREPYLDFEGMMTLVKKYSKHIILCNPVHNKPRGESASLQTEIFYRGLAGLCTAHNYCSTVPFLHEYDYEDEYDPYSELLRWLTRVHKLNR